MSSSSLRSSSKEEELWIMEGVSVLTINLLRVVNALPSAYAWLSMGVLYQDLMVSLLHAGKLSLVLVPSCLLHVLVCSVVQICIFSAVRECDQIQALNVLVNSLSLESASEDCIATYCRNSNRSKCALQTQPVFHDYIGKSFFAKQIRVKLRETSQMCSLIEACSMSPNSLARLDIECTSGMNLPDLFHYTSDDSSEQGIAELLKVLDTTCTMQQLYEPIRNYNMYSWTPNAHAGHFCGKSSVLVVISSAKLTECEANDDDKESRCTKSPLIWSPGCLPFLRNLNSTKMRPSGIRFKLAFLTFLLISSLLPSTVAKPKNHRKGTVVLLVMVCLLHPAEAFNLPLPHMSTISPQTREATNETFTIPLKGSPNTGYCAMIEIGSVNKQEFCVLIDTGSANLAVAGKAHPDIDSYFLPNANSPSYRDLGRTVKVSYTAGTWTGRLAKDLISIGGSSPVDSFLAVIQTAEDFYIRDADWVGIMGLAYSNLAKPDSSVTPFWETFRAATKMADIFSLRFCPPLDIPLLDITEPKGGNMVVGGIDQTLYHEPIFYTSLVQQRFYNVLVTNLTVGDTVITLDCSEFNNDQSIVDSGTTDVFLPQTVFAEVKKAFIDNFKNDLPFQVPEEFWIGGYKLAWPVDDKHSIYSAFPTFYLSLAVDNNASQEFSLAVTPQIYLRQIEGTSEEQANTNCFPECDFFTFGIKQRERGTVIGGNIMLGFYSIFDRENQRIGFAQSTCKYQDEVGGVPHIVGPYMRDPIDCECAGCNPGTSYWEITTYVCGVIVIPLAILSVMIAVCRRVHHSNFKSKARTWLWNKYNKCCNRKTSTPETEEGDQATRPELEGACGTGPASPDRLQEHATLVLESDEIESDSKGVNFERELQTLYPVAKAEEAQPLITGSTQEVILEVEATSEIVVAKSERENYNIVGYAETEDTPLLSSSESDIEAQDTDSRSDLQHEHYKLQDHSVSTSRTVCTEAPVRTFVSQRTHYLTPPECRHAVQIDRQLSGAHRHETEDDFARQASYSSQTSSCDKAV